MQLQVFAVLENGVSKLFPRQADTLRVLLILPNEAGASHSEPDRGGHKPTPIRRRPLLASVAPGF